MLYQKLESFSEKLRKMTMAVLIFWGFVMLVVTIVHIFFRYVLDSSLTWSDEFLRTSLVWFGMLSMSTLSATRAHVAITLFVNKFPPKVQYVISIIIHCIITIAVVVVFMLGIKLVINAGHRVTPSLRLPYRLTYCAIPLGFFLVSVYEIRNFVGVLTGVKPKVKEEILVVVAE